jgi:hypothetical protein
MCERWSALAAVWVCLQLGRGNLSWKRTSGADVLASGLGDPTTGTESLLCICDETGVRLAARVPSGGSCGPRVPKPC